MLRARIGSGVSDRWQLLKERKAYPVTVAIENLIREVPWAGEDVEGDERVDHGIRRVHSLYEGSRSQSLAAELSSDRCECSLSFIFRSGAHITHRDGNASSRGASVFEIAITRRRIFRATTGWSAARTGDSGPSPTAPRCSARFESAHDAFEPGEQVSEAPAAKPDAS
jgi:hypothetical protein